MGTTYMQKEWTKREGYLPALSIQQPFATAILDGPKRIEIRSWGTSYRGLLLLHAGKKFYGEQIDPVRAAKLAKEVILRLKLPWPFEHKDYPLGALVGIATLIRCAHFSEDGWERLRDQHCATADWDRSEYGWQLADIHKFAEPIPFRGQMGLFPVEEALIATQIEQVAQ